MSEHNPWQEPVVQFYQQHKNIILFSVFLLFAGIAAWEYQKEQTKARHYQLTTLQTQWMAQNDANDPEANHTLESMKALDKNALITQLVMAASAKNQLNTDPQKAVAVYQELLSICDQPFCDLYRLRLSVIYMNMKAPNEAINVLNAISNPSYSHFRDLYLGDAYKAADQKNKAIEIWKKAYKNIPVQNISPADKGIKDQLTYRLQKEFS
jgi:predicted negative regulator of RcsB-dependent stress response